MEKIFLYIIIGALTVALLLMRRANKKLRKRIKNLDNDPIILQRKGTLYRKSQIMRKSPEEQWPTLKKKLGI